METSKLPLDANGNIDVPAWALENLDQDIISKNIKDLSALQRELQDQ